MGIQLSTLLRYLCVAQPVAREDGAEHHGCSSASIHKKKPASCRPLLDYCFFADLRAFRFLRIAICFLRSSMLAYANCDTNGPVRQTFGIQMENLLRTTTDRPVRALVTFTRVPKGSVR